MPSPTLLANSLLLLTWRVRIFTLSAAAPLPPKRTCSEPGLRALLCGDMRGVRLNLLSLITARVSSLPAGLLPAQLLLRCKAASSSAIRCIAAPMRDCRSSSSALRRLPTSPCKHTGKLKCSALMHAEHA